VKLSLLAHGVCIHQEAIEAFLGRFLEKKYRFGRSDDRYAPSIVPYEIELPGDVIVGVHHNATSPWEVQLDGTNKLGLYRNNSFICIVRFVEKPRFWRHRLPCGILADEVAVLYTKYALTFFSNSFCHYWEEGLPCRFCSLKPTRKAVAKVVDVVSPVMARESVELALQLEGHKINCIKFTSGTYKDRDRGILEAIEVWNSIIPVSRENILHHLVAMPSKDFSLFHELKRTGIDTISMSLEVTDPKIFQDLCPGKARDIGYEGYIEAFEVAVKVFGFGKVYCALVGGLEPLDSMYSNLHKFAEKGIVPSVNIFHPDMGSPMAKHPRPSEEYLQEMVLRETKLFDQWRFEPCVRGNTRNSLDHECVRGFFR
jgi:hypothetical protein